MNERKKRKKQPRSYIKVIIIAIPLLLILCIYLGISLYFTEHFYYGSIINGTDYTGKTVEQVESVLAEDIKKYSLTLLERDGIKEVITAEDIDYHYVSDGAVQELKDRQNPFLWPYAYFKEEAYEMSVTTTYDPDLLEETVLSLACFQPENIIKPKNASYGYEDQAYYIKEEIKGNQLKEEIVLELAHEAVKKGENEIDLEEHDAYKKPSITKKNKNLVQLVKKLNKYIKVTVTYEFGDRSEVLDGNKINEWLVIQKKKDKSYGVTFDETAVREYIDVLARTYNTFGNTRKFQTWDGSYVTVKGGDYGWLISRSVETKALIEVIKEGKSVKREPIYLQSAYNRNTNDIGDTYVEINLTAQHMWFYKNGKLIVDTDVVTGNVSRNYETPAGTYQITYKERNATLKGENYRTPVNYWLPFNRNIGIHDATWRKDFGGELYKKSGSHGCVNTPYENAKLFMKTLKQAYLLFVIIKNCQRKY